jgi:23S rRNA (guanosine2251-2'-O)-methyltransferase
VADPQRHYVFGFHALAALLQRAPERVLELWMREPRADRRALELRAQAQSLGVRVQFATDSLFEKMVGDAAHQGVVASIRPMALWDENRLLTALDSAQHAPFLLVLDGVTDPHNLGACLRTAAAAAIDALIIPKDRAAQIDGTVRKVAAGAVEQVPLVAVTNLARTLDALKSRNIWVVGLDGAAERSVYAADLRGALALVLGGEGEGMRRLTRERCDFLVRIPMTDAMESLNVSVAAGITMFEARRQRGA